MTEKDKKLLRAEMKKRFPSFFGRLAHKLQQEKNRADLANKTKKRIDDFTN